MLPDLFIMLGVLTCIPAIKFVANATDIGEL